MMNVQVFEQFCFPQAGLVESIILPHSCHDECPGLGAVLFPSCGSRLEESIILPHSCYEECPGPGAVLFPSCGSHLVESINLPSFLL